MPTGIYSRPPIETRFWQKVVKTDKCWLWQASLDHHGYGRITFNGKVNKAHRLSWELAYGPIPLGLDVLHKCDNPPCVRLDHLFLGTQKDNIQDCVKKGRLNRAFGQNNGSAKLTGTQVLEIREELTLGGNVIALAKKYGVNRSVIYAIKYHWIWKHI